MPAAPCGRGGQPRPAKGSASETPEARSSCTQRQDGALYRNNPHIALLLDRWATAESRHTDTALRYEAGYVQALADMAAFLRQTYYLPEGGE